jgi:hypothetical protein
MPDIPDPNENLQGQPANPDEGGDGQYVPDPEFEEVLVVGKKWSWVKAASATILYDSFGWIDCQLQSGTSIACSPEEYRDRLITAGINYLPIPVKGAVAVRALKAVNLPAWRKISIDMIHILEMSYGRRPSFQRA